MKRIFTLLGLLCSLAVFSQRYYVRPTGDDDHSGLSWGSAFKTLQKALTVAGSGDFIWVAAGTYYPDELGSTNSNNPSVAFALKSGVVIYGGFPNTETLPSFNDRNPRTNATILSGEIQANSDISDNAYHVVVASFVDATAKLDGFIITGGNAHGSNAQEMLGGGLYSTNSLLIINSCTFAGNAATASGGAIYIDGGSPTLSNCTFSGNTANRGGALFTNLSAPTLGSCTFSSNTATAGGGGIFNDNSTFNASSCTFSGNTADEGGGLYNGAGSPSLNQCSFTGNHAQRGGGLFNNTTAPTLTGCTFSENTAADGGGVFNLYAPAHFTKCNFSDNDATLSGAGIHNIFSSPVLTHCTFLRNASVYGGGALYNAGSSPSLAWCSFLENTAGTTGGGMMNREVSFNYSSPTLTYCSFLQNSASFSGGGLYNDNHSSTSLANCRFWQNNAIDGGAMTNVSYSTLSLVNCSIAGNTSNSFGGGLYNHLNASATLTNCIAWGNTAAGAESNIYDDETSTSTVTYSMVPGRSGEGNKEGDPKFANIAAGDLHLQGGSPAIDAGYNTAIPAALTMDLDSFPRIYHTTVDMGIYEYMACPIDGILYVKQGGSGLKDGTSWDNALSQLQDALFRSNLCSGVTQIWVAAGTYYPDEGAGRSDNDRDQSFVLKTGLALYGGFAGTENALTERVAGSNETILSGDLDQNTLFDNNAYHVVWAEGVNNTAILDRFTITGGFANGSTTESKQGAGMYNTKASPTVRGCLFKNNAAGSYGGGMVNVAASAPIVMDCSFTGNNATNGGGMENYNSSPTLTNCTFSGNSSSSSSYGGGGLHNSNSSPVLTNCTFTNNRAINGGGLYNLSSSPALTGCSFTGNTANSNSGGGIYNNNSSPTLTNCSFVQNTAIANGGALHNSGSAPTLTNCNFTGNTANSGGALYNSGSAPILTTSLTGCSFTANTAQNGGGMYNYLSSPALTTCDFSQNTASSFGGGVYNYKSSPTLTNCTFTKNTAMSAGAMDNFTNSSPMVNGCVFTENTATKNGGAVYNATTSDATFTNCRFVKNSALQYGGAVTNDASAPTLINCLFWGNTAANGGAVNNFNGSASLLTNCTMAGNTATTQGKAVYNTSSSPTLTNCILWGNSPAGEADIYNGDEAGKPVSVPVVQYSIVQGGFSGNGNKDADPRFVAATTGDLRLQACSPAINAGSNAALPTGVTTDLAGNLRIYNGTPATDIIDMGAYELQAEPRGALSIENVTVSKSMLAPPNHKMQDITLSYTVSGGCDPKASVAVTSSEAINGTGDGDTDPDWVVTDATHLQLRAERAAQGSGRIYYITITAEDITGTTSKTVEVHVAHNITAPQSGASFKLGSTVALAGEFWDKAGNRHTAKWLIDNNTTVKGTVTEPSGAKNGKVTGAYRFPAAGVYKLQMNVTDQSGVTSYANTAGDLEAIVVIYNPSGGYTYGGGFFNSPAGALKAAPQATGKVSYGFTVNYFKGATLPKGETQLEFKVGEFEFNALNLEYLAVEGARAQFRGTGKITGGQSGINFIMTVIDGALNGSGTDKVRMKIFNKNTGQVYYDNESGLSDASNPTTLVGAGSTVVIQSTPLATGPVTTQAVAAPEVAGLEVSVQPNPTSSNFAVGVRTANHEERITLQVLDQSGRLVEERIVTGELTHLGAAYRPGVYYIRVVQGVEHKEVKVIKLSD